MTVTNCQRTTASGDCRLRPAGAERSSFGNTIFGWAVRLYVSKRRMWTNRERPAWEDGSQGGVQRQQSTCGLSIRTATGQCGLQHLHRVLPFVEGGDGVDVQIHAQSVAELIGDQLRIDTGLTGKTGMRASHDLKRRPIVVLGRFPGPLA